MRVKYSRNISLYSTYSKYKGVNVQVYNDRISIYSILSNNHIDTSRILLDFISARVCFNTHILLNVMMYLLYYMCGAVHITALTYKLTFSACAKLKNKTIFEISRYSF
jgi:hypothetical protein